MARVCISDKLPGEAAYAGAWTTENVSLETKQVDSFCPFPLNTDQSIKT